jgi:hypothetical protein
MQRRNFIALIGTATAATLAGLVPTPEDPYDKFLRTLRTKVIAILRRDGTTFSEIQIDPIEEIGGEEFRFIRLWIVERQKALTWHHPY